MLNTHLSTTSNTYKYHSTVELPHIGTVNDSEIDISKTGSACLEDEATSAIPSHYIRTLSMLIPKPFPEELDFGYLGRLICINGVATANDLLEKLAIWAGVSGKSRSEVSCLELLSLASGIELSLFVSQHTSLPLRHAIIADPPNMPHGCAENTSLLWSHGMRLLRNDAYFCHKCVYEDLDFHGQSFWRRGHQIPGAHCCQQHGVPLHFVANAKSAFLSPPSSFVDACQEIDVNLTNIFVTNNHINTYLEICHGLIGTNSPIGADHVAEVLKNRARILGFKTRGFDGKLLSDAVVEAFGRDWLRTVLPELADKQISTPLHKLDHVTFQKNSVTSVYVYILACVILYESSDDALTALLSAKVSIKKKPRPKTHINSNDLLAAYTQAQGKYAIATHAFKEPRHIVTEKFKQLGLPNLKGTVGKSIFVAAKAFYIEKLSVIQSAHKGNISIDSMENLIRQSGIGMQKALAIMHNQSGQSSRKMGGNTPIHKEAKKNTEART